VGEPLPLAGALPCYNLYAMKDGGLLALAALEPSAFARFLEVAGRPGLAPLQYRDSAAARRRIAALVASRTRAEWTALLAAEDLPAEPVLSAAEALAHPQMAARGLVRRGPDGLPRLAFPARLGGVRPRAGARVPKVGEDTGAVLKELGIVPPAGIDGIGRPSRWRRLLRKLRPGR
jgi:alpha-methylacyl-CoA racemase